MCLIFLSCLWPLGVSPYIHQFHFWKSLSKCDRIRSMWFWMRHYMSPNRMRNVGVKILLSEIKPSVPHECLRRSCTLIKVHLCQIQFQKSKLISVSLKVPRRTPPPRNRRGVEQTSLQGRWTWNKHGENSQYDVWPRVPMVTLTIHPMHRMKL